MPAPAIRLILAGASYLVAWCLYRATGRPWQIGGMLQAYEPSLLFVLVGTVLAVLSFPRHRRLPVGIMVLILAASFVVLWPTWEAHVFPDALSPENLIAHLTSLGVEPSTVILYTTARERGVTLHCELSNPVPDQTRVIGFRCAGTGFRALWLMMSRGWNVYPYVCGG